MHDCYEGAKAPSSQTKWTMMHKQMKKTQCKYVVKAHGESKAVMVFLNNITRNIYTVFHNFHSFHYICLDISATFVSIRTRFIFPFPLPSLLSWVTLSFATCRPGMLRLLHHPLLPEVGQQVCLLLLSI